MQYLIAIAFVAIIGSLAAAVYFMLRGGSSETDSAQNGNGNANANTQKAPPPSKKMAWALALRVAISVLIFLGILLAWKLGYIHPTGVPQGK